jgi:hypothetical protein
LEEAKLRTNLILIENFEDFKISSSCLTFSELINVDTFKLKLNVHMMKILQEYFIKRGMDLRTATDKCSKK